MISDNEFLARVECFLRDETNLEITETDLWDRLCEAILHARKVDRDLEFQEFQVQNTKKITTQ